ncbi:MAG: DUF302 domain-containing protein [Actinomycetota bacterium]|nr:DUF302 domain-containing protein [Actinomycetota bacterium]
MTRAITEATVPIRRVTITTDAAFDDVVAAVYAGLGRAPDFGEFVQQCQATRDAGELDSVVDAVSGSSGLIEFLSLDLGGVLAIRDPARSRRLLRIIAGNPVTMSTMAATAPDVGSYAPVTILIAEGDGGTTLSYDRVVSAIAPYGSDEATAVARSLDDAVVALLTDAAG